MEILIILILTLINGIFSMSEMSLVSSKKFKLEKAKNKGSKGAKTALELSENPTKFLSTVQIGITLIGILMGVYSGENLTKGVEDYLMQFEIMKYFAHNTAVGLIVLSVTYISIVLGELLPKRIAMTFPEPIAIILALPMKMLSIITSPFVWLLTATNDILLKILGIANKSNSIVSEEEIKSIIQESTDGGEIQEIEQDIVERVFDLGDRKVTSLFTHRSDLIYFRLNDSFEEVKRKINQEKHSAYPVCEEKIDNVIGIVMLKDLFDDELQTEFSLNKIIRPALFINENALAYNVLDIFKKEKKHCGIVLDEYGMTKGLVSMDDLVDALLGDASEENVNEYLMVQQDENTWLSDGQYSLSEFQRYFQLDIEDDLINKYATIGGLFIHFHKSIPEIGDNLTLQEVTLEVINKTGKRINKIKITKN